MGSRAERLLALMQALRRHRLPIPGKVLADEMGISLRTLYRDIATLQSQGACIEGEAGVGYQLKPGFTLPPLMLTEQEMMALILGIRWVANRTDAELKESAHSALSKILAVLPEKVRLSCETVPLLIGPKDEQGLNADVSKLKEAIFQEHKCSFDYMDAQKQETHRVVWPIAIGYFEQVTVLIAWCEARKAFRHFRVDRIYNLNFLEDRYPKRRYQLLGEWKKQENIDS